MPCYTDKEPSARHHPHSATFDATEAAVPTPTTLMTGACDRFKEDSLYVLQDYMNPHVHTLCPGL